MRYFKKFIALGILGAILGIGLGFLGPIHPAFDTFSHFRLHVSLGLVLMGIIILFRKWLILGSLATLTGIMGLYTASIGTTFTARILEPDITKPVYSLLHFNLFWVNTERKLAIDHIIKLDPELISLSEAGERWSIDLQRLYKNWPFMLHCAEWGKRGGVKFLSKWPLDKSNEYCGIYGSFAKTEITSPEGVKFTSGSVHVRWPWPASGPKQIDTLIPELNKIKDDALFAGDFNATPWSWSVQRFAKAANMQITPGIGSTWIVDELPIQYTWWAGLPIDNVMSKGRIKVLSAKTIEDLGSDHLPVLVKFQIQ